MSHKTRRWINDWDISFPRRRSPWQRVSPPQLFVGSFILLIVFGAVGFRLLPGLYTGEPLSWLDAFFTSASAVCVTGLIVVDTASYFTVWGQAYILLLIQLGGLGVITFTTLIIMTLGRRLSLRHEALAASTADISPYVDVGSLTRDVFRFTFVFEGVGALLLYVFWIPRYGLVEALWPAIFHAVSAFCNAGFSTFSDSLMGFQSHLPVLLVITVLVVAGGIGFLTLEELYLQRRSAREKRTFQLSVHSRIALAVSAILLVLGSVLYLLFEWNVTFAEIPIWARPMNALFMSASSRTAGFNSVDFAHASESSNFLTVILMAIGGSPGSMAGGMKTTTFALIGLLAWSRFRGHSFTTVWGRSIPGETMQRAVGLFVVVFGVLTTAIFAFTVTEVGPIGHDQAGGSFLMHMFEASSAFNTVGLSMGATGDLSTPGRLLTILLMYLGRVGPLTFAAALTLRTTSRRSDVRYAYEDVVVG